MIPYGVDLVELGRAERVMRRSGSLILPRLATPAEARWIGDDAGRLAVVIAVKEAAIKALGGRPPGFHWWDVVVSPEAGWAGVPPSMYGLLEGFAREAGLAEVSRSGAWIHGASGAALRRLLEAPGDDADGVAGAAIAGIAQGHVWVAVAFWLPEGMER